MERMAQDQKMKQALETIRKAAPEARQFLQRNAMKPSDPAFDSMDKNLKAIHARETESARRSHEHSREALPGVVLEALLLRSSQTHVNGALSQSQGWLSSASITCHI